ncbi:2-hydroxychromene-2-carboxylate isomerase [Sphingomonas immobilis]|uniref:2-hydroxychromene-2-carboxylate isomerase n=1 Tax=Sphingomonas immobilis TaxID=3063997 RepID=A0ABT9A4Z9_9SPHN|nr:2-hydroxychromene-2-carboxylate isomerase [Sphingomonas sp. CA1-15]MDO7844041.1 2-hydroxychromene-2-carboxylate isomerase [Sphingomonas sp. CA1-15]
MADVALECFFDCSSPWTYLGVHNLKAMARRLGIEIQWKPIIVGGVFNKVNPAVYEMRANPPSAPKAAYVHKDIQDWARFSGLTINEPPACGHPVNAVKCMRACITLRPSGKLDAFATAAFESLWIDGRNLADDVVLRDICAVVDVDAEWLLAAIATPEIKQALWDNTNEAMDRGAFGSPTFFVDHDDMYFGNDHLPLVEFAIEQRRQVMAAMT